MCYCVRPHTHWSTRSVMVAWLMDLLDRLSLILLHHRYMDFFFHLQSRSSTFFKFFWSSTFFRLLVAVVIFIVTQQLCDDGWWCSWWWKLNISPLGTSLKLGFCGKPNWAQRLNGNISHNFQCILSGNGTFPNISETSGHTLLEMNSNMRAASLQKDKRTEGWWEEMQTQ